MTLAEVTINCVYCCCGCCCWLCCSMLLSAAAQPHQLFPNLWLHLLMYVLGLTHALHTGVTIPSLLSRPSRRVVSTLALPTFTAAVAGPQLNLPSTSSLAPSSSSTASALTTTAISQPITSPPLLPPSAPQLPSCLSCQIPTLPKKLTETILAGEYIDLSDLLPEQLRINTPSHSSSTKEVVIIPESSWDTRRRKKRQITDIATWVEVFSTYILVLSTQFPEYWPELVAYQLSIVKLSKRFRYPSWLFYDAEYRKWAAVNHIKTWSKTNSELFALAFTGQAVGVTWCPVCQVEGGDHTYDCPRYPSNTSLPNSSPVHQPKQQPVYRGVPSLLETPTKRSPSTHCILYNKNAGACPYGTTCRFLHVCSYGFSPHPVTNCTSEPTRRS